MLLKLTPKNLTVVFGLRIIQVIIVERVTILPTDKSVPARRINPATPNAKNTFVEKFLRIKLRESIPINEGVRIIHPIINIIMIIYNPFLNKNCLKSKLYK